MGGREMHIGFWWEDNIKMDLKEIGWGVCTGLIWLMTETSGGLL
jgi:hypothetical protein